jgi:hypothetical protein
MPPPLLALSCVAPGEDGTLGPCVRGWIGGVPLLLLWRYSRPYSVPPQRGLSPPLALLLRASDGNADACRAAISALTALLDGDGLPQQARAREAVLAVVRTSLAPVLAAADVMRRSADAALIAVESADDGVAAPAPVSSGKRDGDNESTQEPPPLPPYGPHPPRLGCCAAIFRRRKRPVHPLPRDAVALPASAATAATSSASGPARREGAAVGSDRQRRSSAAGSGPTKAAVAAAATALKLPTKRTTSGTATMAGGSSGSLVVTGTAADLFSRLLRGCAAVIDALLLGAPGTAAAHASSLSVSTLIADVDSGAQTRPPLIPDATTASIAAAAGHPVVRRWREALAAAAPPVATASPVLSPGWRPPPPAAASAAAAAGTGDTQQSLLLRAALAILEGTLDAAGLCALGDASALSAAPTPPVDAGGSSSGALSVVSPALRLRLRAAVPPEVAAAARAPRFSAALGGVLSACWKGDAIAGPPAGGVSPAFVAALCESLGLRGAEGEGAPAPWSRLVPLLDSPALSLLVHGPLVAALNAARRSGGQNDAAECPPVASRLRLAVPREPEPAVTAGGLLAGLSQQLKAAGALPEATSSTSRGGTARVLHPAFTAAGGSGATEEGEGHGPRKEAFTLIAAQAAASWGAWTAGPGTATLTPGTARLLLSVPTPSSGVAARALASSLQALAGGRVRLSLPAAAGGGGGSQGVVAFEALVTEVSSQSGCFLPVPHAALSTHRCCCCFCC